VHFPFFFSHDGKETKDLALAARRPFTALGAKTAKLASLEQTPFLRSLRPKGPRLRSLGRPENSSISAIFRIMVTSNKPITLHANSPKQSQKATDRPHQPARENGLTQ